MAQDSNSTKPNKGGRPRKGSIQYRGRTWYAVLTVTIDGESMRKWVRLDTDNKAIARRKLARLLKDTPGSLDGLTEAAQSPEAYKELADRVGASRKVAGIADTYSEELREKHWILDEIGHLPVTAIRSDHIAGIYENARAAGKSLSHLRHLRAVLRTRFMVALQEEMIASSPVDRVKLPKVKIDRRERAVVTDVELAIYLAWLPERERAQLGVLERQTMSALARMFGGLRAGDIHSLDWTRFDTKNGAFTWGIAPRRKTARPQRITVPESLRPILKDWWMRAGKPSEGLVFPALRGKRAGVGEKIRVGHAAALRRDLKAAFKAYREVNANLGPAVLDTIVPAEDSPRWVELFEETELTRPVDFHSWRRRFVQALADTGVNAQQAQKLAGHADLTAHERYLRSSAKTLTIPAGALPLLGVSWKPSSKLICSAPDPSMFCSGSTRIRTEDLRIKNPQL
jgi:integrase